MKIFFPCMSLKKLIKRKAIFATPKFLFDAFVGKEKKKNLYKKQYCTCTHFLFCQRKEKLLWHSLSSKYFKQPYFLSKCPFFLSYLLHCQQLLKGRKKKLQKEMVFNFCRQNIIKLLTRLNFFFKNRNRKFIIVLLEPNLYFPKQ